MEPQEDYARKAQTLHEFKAVGKELGQLTPQGFQSATITAKQFLLNQIEEMGNQTKIMCSDLTFIAQVMENWVREKEKK